MTMDLQTHADAPGINYVQARHCKHGMQSNENSKREQRDGSQSAGGGGNTKKTGSHFSKDKVSISITGLPNISFLTLTAVQADSYSSPNGPCCSG